MTNAKMHQRPAYRIRQCSDRERSRQASNCCASVWFKRLIVLSTSSHAHEGLGHFSHFMGARPSDKHLAESFRNVRFLATVAFKRLGVELTFTISGHVDLLQLTSGCHQITGVGAQALAFALGAAFSPCGSNERI
jgi:hypothetical protein